MIRPLLLWFLVLLPLCCGSWGFAVHRHINGAAVDSLEDPLRGWFASHRQWLSEHAVDADKRKRMVEREAPRHYVDLDAPALSCLDSLGRDPWFSKAVEACVDDSLWAYGVLPWNIEWAHSRLVEAMDARDREAILRAAADLGHYAADAHVPLHTTLNYNGQLTGQDGIHALWETRLPERYGGGYFCGRPAGCRGGCGSMGVENHPGESRSCGQCLEFERELVEGWEGDLVVREQRGRVMQLQRVPEWCDAYHGVLDGMVERRWRHSIHGVASVWTSAWWRPASLIWKPRFSRCRGLLRWWHRLKSSR